MTKTEGNIALNMDNTKMELMILVKALNLALHVIFILQSNVLNLKNLEKNFKQKAFSELIIL